MGFGPQGNAVRIALDIGDNLDIVEIGEHKFLAAFHDPKAEAAPEIDQALLRMAIEFLVSLCLAELDPGA